MLQDVESLNDKKGRMYDGKHSYIALAQCSYIVWAAGSNPMGGEWPIPPLTETA